MALSQKTKVKQTDAIRKLSRVPTFNLGDAAKVGISRTTVARLVERNVFKKIERGLYSVPESEPLGEAYDFAVACKRFGPRSVIGGLSALFGYGLIEVVPTQVWVLVPSTVRASSSRYRLLRTKRNLTDGVVSKDGYRITSIERTLLDSLIFASKIGERNAVAATIRALRQKDTSDKKLFQLAKKIDALTILDRYWQSILAGVSQ